MEREVTFIQFVSTKLPTETGLSKYFLFALKRTVILKTIWSVGEKSKSPLQIIVQDSYKSRLELKSTFEV